jgi:3-oxoacyl-[acyl-carrier protein] reductase
MSDLQGRVALVTGAAQGLRRAIAALLAQRGATVHALDRGSRALNTTGVVTKAEGAPIRPHIVDATHEGVPAVVRRHICIGRIA